MHFNQHIIMMNGILPILKSREPLHHQRRPKGSRNTAKCQNQVVTAGEFFWNGGRDIRLSNLQHRIA